MTERLVVVGGDAAGMSAAMQVRRRRPDREIVVLERGGWTSYSACGIPYLVGGTVDELEDLVARSPVEFGRDHDVDVRLGHDVRAIDLDRRRVEAWDTVNGATVHVDFDQLHLATGANPVRPDLPGLDLPFVHGVQTLADASRLLEQVTAQDCRRVVVVGGGYIGLEMAEAFVERGAAVTLVDGGDHVMPSLDADVAGPLVPTMEGLGIVVRLGTRVEGVEPAPSGAGGTVVAGGDRFDVDLVVLGLGVTPNAGLAAEAGLTTGVKGAVRVDRRQATSADGVWAAGDCCESFHRVAQVPVHVALGTIANKQGRVAGVNLAGGHASFPGIVGTAVTKLCGNEIGRTGLGESEAVRYGFAPVAVTVEGTTRAGYFPGAEPLRVKAVAELGSRRLIGAQIVGGQGSARRIDVVAVALTAGMTVDEVVDLDLGYAPPFGSVWEPLHVAARKLAAALDVADASDSATERRSR